ncbi:hypothetical protein ABZP36_001034 [Zizania latifolia]
MAQSTVQEVGTCDQHYCAPSVRSDSSGQVARSQGLREPQAGTRTVRALLLHCFVQEQERFSLGELGVGTRMQRFSSIHGVASRNGGCTGRTRNRTGMVLAIAFPIVAAILAAIVVFFYLSNKKRERARTQSIKDSSNPEDMQSIDSLILSLSTLRAATDNFDESNKLGEGGFGAVYKVWENWTAGTVVEIKDPSLGGNCPGDQILKCIHIGLLCVQEDPADRPTMSTVNIMLSSSTVSLQAPSRPAFCFQKSGADSDTYSEPYRGVHRSSPVSPNEVSMTELDPR